MFHASKINEDNIGDFFDIIPQNYHGEIKTNSLFAIVVYEDDSPFGIFLSDLMDDWVYLVWFYFFDEKETMVKKASFFRYCISQAKKDYGKELKGAVFEITSIEEDLTDIRDVLHLVGMNVREAKNNVFEFTLSQVEETEALKKASEKLECRCLSDMSEGDLRTIDTMMQEDDRPVPVPLLMDWDVYLSDISVFAIKKDNPCGALLFSEKDEDLVAEVAYAADPVALPAMLGTAYTKAFEKYGGEKKVLIPVVVNKTAELVERIVPQAVREDVIEGVFVFDRDNKDQS